MTTRAQSASDSPTDPDSKGQVQDSAQNGAVGTTHPDVAGGTQSGSDEPHIDMVETYFDDNAKDWSDLYSKAQRVNDLVLADRRDAAVDSLASAVTPGGLIMDAGCGAGRTSLDLVERGYRIHGIDISHKMLDHC